MQFYKTYGAIKIQLFISKLTLKEYKFDMSLQKGHFFSHHLKKSLWV